MNDEFSVYTRDLIAHSHTVGMIADDVEEAGEAGHSVRAGAEAYGRICSFLPPLLGVLQDTLLQGITESADDLRDTARKLRTTADQYDSIDAVTADAVTRSGRSE